jgi:hypothetical protein
MNAYRINPLEDPRWAELLSRHPDASIFHTPGWLKALRQTYGYEPVAYTTSPPQEDLKNGLVFCQVRSWITGRRLVSLPFSDHCEPLLDQMSDFPVIMSALDKDPSRQEWKYIELRPVTQGLLEGLPSFGKSSTFTFHKIDLRRDAQLIYRSFHDSCVRRKIKKAEKEELVYESGRSESLLGKFYHLMVITRRRHMLPPQPLVWFRSLVESLADRLTIHVLSKRGEPIAAIITLRYKESLMYKYGCSNAKFHNLGAMPLLFWKIIQAGKQEGATELDLGRSEREDKGLVTFKGNLGGVASELNYYRCAPVSNALSMSEASVSLARRTLASLPNPIFVGVGRLFYRHIG